jgi:hypothetical protein
MNGLLRDYFPNGTDLSAHSAEELTRVAIEVNERPRKTLGWNRPTDLFDSALQSARPGGPVCGAAAAGDLLERPGSGARVREPTATAAGEGGRATSASTSGGRRPTVTGVPIGATTESC